MKIQSIAGNTGLNFAKTRNISFGFSKEKDSISFSNSFQEQDDRFTFRNKNIEIEIEGYEPFDKAEYLKQQNSSINQSRSETRELVNDKLTHYSHITRGALSIDRRAREAVYGLKPETIESLRSKRILYSMVAGRKVIGNSFHKKPLDINKRIMKINQIEEIFTEDELINIGKSIYAKGVQVDCFLEWLLVSDNPKDDEKLIQKAKKWTKADEKKYMNRDKVSWFNRIFVYK